MTAATRRRAVGQWIVLMGITVLIIGGIFLVAGEVLLQGCACTTPPGPVAPPAAWVGRPG